jgi:zinc and cadmium transporter
MIDVWINSILAVVIVSLISLVGIAFISLKEAKLRRILLFLVSFAAGALMGDAFIHLLPEVVGEFGFTIMVSTYLLAGIVIFFIIEKVIHWKHCHVPTTSQHPHHLAPMNLIGDGVHNFIDGIVIAASFLVSIPVGVATTIAVLLHEIPQEIGDFGILLHAGWTKKKAIAYNFITALTALLGVVLTLFLFGMVENITLFILPFAAGGFIYIAGSDLIPEIHKTCEARPSALQFISFVLGILVMFSLILLE